MDSKLKSRIIRLFERRMKKRNTRLKAGQPAPDFVLPDQDGRMFRLSDNKGRKTVLYFYPKDNTTGCTIQSCNLRDHYAELQSKGYDIYGISTDGEKSHRKFISDYKLPFPLLADTRRSVVKKYDVYTEWHYFGRTIPRTTRTTFVVDEKGMLERVITDIDTAHHNDQILKPRP